MFSVLLVACAVFPLLSIALPSSPTHSLHHRASHRPHIMTYYADWAPPQSIDYSLFDTVIFAFALPDQDYHLRWDNDQAPTLLANVVPAAHAASTRVMLSIGGWTGSRHFSNAVATSQNREIFASNILDTYKRYNLDGIDIDWEYPGQISQQGNSESPTDSANMLQFFKVLQQKLPPGAMISAAVQDSTFAGPDGHPMKDVSAFAEVLNWITLMNYDTYGTRQPGPNAPLSNACGNSSQPTQNAVDAFNAWTAAGFPASKIVLGVPGYGYIVESRFTRLSARSPSRAYSEDGSGQIQFSSLINQGILTSCSDGSFCASAGFTRKWDSCSATPFLHSESAGQSIPYDDDKSLGIKAAWVREMKMGGVNLFDAHGDTPEQHLARALRANLMPSPTQSTALSSAMPSSSSAVALSPNTIPLSTSEHPSSSTSQPSLGPLSTILPDGIVLFPRRS